MKAAPYSALPVGFELMLRAALGLVVILMADRLASPVRGANLEETLAREIVAAGRDAETSKTTGASDDPAPHAGPVREGTRLSAAVGQFKLSGDRAVLVTKGQGNFVGLENLNLARVINVIRDDPEAEWTVSGVVTQYRSANYLLITRAVRKNKVEADATGKSTPAPPAAAE